MLSMFFKKERQLESLIYNYLENLGMIQNHFVKAMNLCLKEGVSDDFCFLMDQTHRFESRTFMENLKAGKIAGKFYPFKGIQQNKKTEQLTLWVLPDCVEAHIMLCDV